jgi:hypothetical protein
LTQAQQPKLQDCCLFCIDDLPPAKVAEKHKKYSIFLTIEAPPQTNVRIQNS